MGLLDDAIREHLDLKRRRGADPTEIERAEREALGPVRRGPELVGDEVALTDHEVGPSTEQLDSDQLASEPFAPGGEHWEPFEEDPELQAGEHHDELPPYEPAHGAGGDPLLDDDSYRDSGGAPPPHPADLAAAQEPEPYPSTPPPTSPHVEQETQEYELEPEAEADDDVLETTPEFLQDAPDHDRLWFEQRPPRDFDFDG